LGRVIRTQRPSSNAVTPADQAALNIMDLYYDGARAVQEVGWAGIPMRAQLGTNGQPDNSRPGLPRRANEITGNGASGSQCVPSESSAWAWGDRRLEREYVWAADSSAYVDECVAQLVYTDAHTPVSGYGAGNDTTAVSLGIFPPGLVVCGDEAGRNAVGRHGSRGR
jgi:hypothetical protein